MEVPVEVPSGLVEVPVDVPSGLVEVPVFVLVDGVVSIIVIISPKAYGVIYLI